MIIILSYRNFNKLKSRQPFTLRIKRLDADRCNGRYDPAPLVKGAVQREMVSKEVKAYLVSTDEPMLKT